MVFICLIATVLCRMYAHPSGFHGGRRCPRWFGCSFSLIVLKIFLIKMEGICRIQIPYELGLYLHLKNFRSNCLDLFDIILLGIFKHLFQSKSFN